MKPHHIAVEINLTSNDLILGVRGANHPLPVYRKYGVPIVLSTDDEGVSRTHLTQEYQRAVLTYGLSYADLKTIVRNSIEYSFLPPGEKARARLDLEKRFQRFEQTF
jgi:adenosine deaminase/adenosine deaminase CECR1